MGAETLNRTLRLSELAHFHPRQLECLEALKKYQFVLYGGAAGGGKSYLDEWFGVICLIWAYTLHGVREANFGLFCEDYPSLKDRHLSCWAIPPELGKIAKTETEGLRFKLVDELGGGKVLLRNLDDPGKYDSVQFIGMAVDEWTKNPWQVFHELRKRLRWPMVANKPHLPCGGQVASEPKYEQGKLVKAAELAPCPIELHHRIPAWNFPFLKTTNPGGMCHAETKRVYVDPAAANWSNFPKELGKIKHKFAFVPARAEDNPSNPANYKSENLDTLPEKMRLAYAEGRWDVFEGQYFPNFDPQKRKITPQQIAALVQNWWPRWISSDWGSDHWWITQWHVTGIIQPEQAAEVLGRTDDGGEILRPMWDKPKQIVITYRELILNGRNAEQRLGERAAAEQMIAVTQEWERPLIQDFFFSPEAFGERKSQFRNSIADEIGEVLVKAKLPSPHRADDGRVNGARFLYGLIDQDEMYISTLCPVLLGTYPVLKHPDPNKGETGDPEDVQKTDDISDDSYDCHRYGLKTKLAAGKKPKDVERAELLSQYADPHTQSMVDRVYQERQAKKKRAWNLRRG